MTRAPWRRPIAMSGARDSGDGFVLSTTTLRPPCSASSICCCCRVSRLRAFGIRSLLTCTCVAAKCSWYHEHFAATHVHVSKDLMPNARNRDTRQQQQIEEALQGGRSVVVDNTNPSPESRAPLIAIGRRHGARVIAVYFEAH